MKQRKSGRHSRFRTTLGDVIESIFNVLRDGAKSRRQCELLAAETLLTIARKSNRKVLLELR